MLMCRRDAVPLPQWVADYARRRYGPWHARQRAARLAAAAGVRLQRHRPPHRPQPGHPHQPTRFGRPPQLHCEWRPLKRPRPARRAAFSASTAHLRLPASTVAGWLQALRFSEAWCRSITGFCRVGLMLQVSVYRPSTLGDRVVGPQTSPVV